MAVYSKTDEFFLRHIGRPLTHLTPRYVLDRARIWLFEQRHPNLPWLTADAIKILDSLLRKSDSGLEYGAGRSTIWFAQRVGHLISVETSPEWHERVRGQINQSGLSNVELKLVPADHGPNDPFKTEYIVADDRLTVGSLDFALVDALYRDECAMRAADLLRPGGILIVDNVNWYLPHPTRSPFSTLTSATPLWAEFSARVSSWRHIWTSSGYCDTSIWFKP